MRPLVISIKKIVKKVSLVGKTNNRFYKLLIGAKRVKRSETLISAVQHCSYDARIISQFFKPAFIAALLTIRPLEISIKNLVKKNSLVGKNQKLLKSY
jgi:hypothetical protein